MTTRFHRYPILQNGDTRIIDATIKKGAIKDIDYDLFFDPASSGVTGTAAWTEANDTNAATGSVGVSGTASWTEANDTNAATGSVGSSGTAAWTEADDGWSVLGTVTNPVSGTAAWTEANDTWSIAGQLPTTAQAAWTEANDTWSMSGFGPITGTASWGEQDDVFAAIGNIGETIISIPGENMTSMVSICSNALLMLGADPINALDASEGDRAILCLNLFPSARNAVVREHLWDSCTKRAILAPLSTPPAFGWAYAFQAPSDLHRLWSVGYVDGEMIPHKFEFNQILCDMNPLPIRYIFKNGAVETWDASLIHVMEAYMAKLLAWPITKDRGMVADMTAEYEKRLRRARAADGQQGSPDGIRDSTLISVRGKI